MQITTKTTALAGLLLALAGVAAPRATACSVPGVATWRLPMIVPQGLGPLANLSGSSPAPAPAAQDNASIVGLWFIQFSSGGYVVDQAFDVWHSDGTEVLNDFTDPIEGNVCLGVWSRNGQTYKLKHPSWTFDTSGNLTGTAIIGETVTVDSASNTFAGTYSIDLFDTAGNPVGQYHGTVKATRVQPD